MSLRRNLKRLRSKVSPSAKAFAEELGIGYTKYCSYENGVWPPEKTLIAIADALHVPMDKLLGRSLDEFERFKQIVNEMETGDGMQYMVVEENASEKSSTVVVQIREKESGRELSSVSFGSRADFSRFMRRLKDIHERSSRLMFERLVIDALQIRSEKE